MCTLDCFFYNAYRSLIFKLSVGYNLGALIVPLNYGVGERVGAVEFGLDTYRFLLYR